MSFKESRLWRYPAKLFELSWSHAPLLVGLMMIWLAVSYKSYIGGSDKGSFDDGVKFMFLFIGGSALPYLAEAWKLNRFLMVKNKISEDIINLQKWHIQDRDKKVKDLEGGKDG